ncbi:tetratricopeptide repeat protein [Lacinutrix jangbogonensis]|uniref:tetratricopeptide repeat protein n=1 Tax=Lacinutrix jangbogonensis TaxID=1469557 RepID=UPI00053EA01D|nr:tetratricopeptide repeat protein [Lacinutrix jangbogonensis]
MLQFRKTLYVFFIFCGVISFAQQLTQIERDALLDKVNKDLSYAQENIEIFNYFEAKDSLEKILVNAKILNNEKSLGLVYSKLGKTQYFLEESNLAIKTLIKALEFQRLAQDNTNIAETYKTLGDVYMKTKTPKKALDNYNAAETLFNKKN